MRLIDADMLIDKSWDAENGFGWEKVISIKDVMDAPTIDTISIDTISVIRCKDCRWGREICGNIECFVDCNLPPEYHGYEWFCPNGERKRENETN